MKRITRIALMLAVYLVWIFGNTTIALSCHANRVHTHTHYHINGAEVCDCHHQDWQTPHFESPHSCNHDHSNRIALYNTSKEGSVNIAPVVLSVTAQLGDNLAIEEITSRRSPRNYTRKTPLPPSPTLARRGMRAPPVVA